MKFIFNGPQMRGGATVYLLVSETPEREQAFKLNDEISAEQYEALPAHTKSCIDGFSDSLVARGEVEKVTVPAARGRKSEGE